MTSFIRRQWIPLGEITIAAMFLATWLTSLQPTDLIISVALSVTAASDFI